MINNAQESIQIAMYRFNDFSILQALIQRAWSDNVTVELLLDENGISYNAKDQLYDAGCKIKYVYGTTNIYTNKEGQEKESVGIMYDKILIVDAKYCLSGSYNFTLPAALLSYESMTYCSIPEWINQVLSHYNLIKNSTLVQLTAPIGYMPSPQLVKQQWKYLITQKNNPQHLVYAVRQILGYDGSDYDKAKELALKHIENTN